MLLRYLFLILFFFSSYKSGFSESDLAEINNHFKISFGYMHSVVKFNNSNMLDLCFEIFINDNISVDYILAGNFSKDNTFIHTPLGLIGGLALLAETRETDFSTYDYVILLLILLPEGINYYIPMNEKINVVPYLNPLGYDYLKDDYSITSSIGAKLEINLLKNISLNPFAGIKIFYSHPDASFGLDAGVVFGIRF
ncbi:MAG: hypothetical protein HZB41_01505 [Ignavibacteriae bacterium]|nr:hypothetical protein [Ignavibacteriota bacterium]